MDKVNVLIVRFGNEIRMSEVSAFRGAINGAMVDANVLFHNHLGGDRFRYAYPLVQYKRINGRAAIVCLGEGTEVIGQFFAQAQFDVVLGERPVHLEVDSVRAYSVLVQPWDGQLTYRIHRWLPLNKENYEAYCKEDSLATRCALIERLLVANILSFAKGMDVHFDKTITATLTELSDPMTLYYKGVKLMGFDAEFKTNVSLPDFVGLGKGVSLGMGTVNCIDNNINQIIMD